MRKFMLESQSKGVVITDQIKIGKFLKELRAEHSLTQAQVAEILGVSNRSISRWENGTTMPDFDLLIELAQYYDVEVGEILNGERKDNEEKNMDKNTEELLLKTADYNSMEMRSVSKRMFVMFAISIAGIIVYVVLNMNGLSDIEPWSSIESVCMGFVMGTLLTGLLYTSRQMSKIKAYKVRLLKKLRHLS